MSAKQKRALMSLLTLVVVLGLILAVVKAAGRWAREREAVEAAASQPETLTEAGAAYSALTYHNGSATLSFAMDETGIWYWTNDREFPLDQAAVEKIVHLVESVHPQQTITDGDTLEAYGLTEPSATLTLTASDGTQTTFDFGRTTIDGDSYYILMNGQETPVYIIADDLYKAISRGIYDMMELPEYPQVAQADMKSMTVSGAVETTLTAKAETPEAQTDGGQEAGSEADGEETAVSWRSGGRDVTGQEAVSALVKLMEMPKVDACVDYRPSDEAVTICGFEEPSATVELRYTGDGGVDAVRTLTVGGKTTDGESYYIRMDEDTTIYRIKADTLADVLAVAAEGLAG